MVEYGVKKIITNPTLITNSKDIVKVVDGRSKETKAFIIPSTYTSIVEKIIKEIEYEKWAKDKSLLIKDMKTDKDLDTLSEKGIEAIVEYLDD
jgi:hypothetical protein